MTSRKKNRVDNSIRVEQQPDQPTGALESVFGSFLNTDTKTIQLCRQVEEALMSALACSANPVLRDLNVVGVQPLRGSASLRVLVSIDGEDDTKVNEALKRAGGYFRGEVARAITRKRVPTLSFLLVPAGGGDSDFTVERE